MKNIINCIIIYIISSTFFNFFYIFENNYYLDMVSCGKKNHFNMFTNNFFIIKTIILYLIIYIAMTFLIYRFIIINNEPLYIAFFLGISISILSNFISGWVSEKTDFIIVMLYDALTSGIAVLLTTYIFRNYYEEINNYLFLIIILNIIVTIFLFYNIFCYSFKIQNFKEFISKIKN